MALMPYDTTICRMYQTDKIVSQIKRAEILQPLQEATTPNGSVLKDIYFITPSDEHSDVTSFTQFLNLGTDQEPKLVFDARPYMREERRTGTYRLTAVNDYLFQCIRMVLTQRFILDGDSALRRLGDVPILTFSKWVTFALAQRFNLDLGVQMKMQIICVYYYLSLVDRYLRENHNERLEIANIVSRLTRFDINTVRSTIAEVGNLADGNDLAYALSTATGTIRMGELKFADLFTLIASSFFGVNYRENAGVALEHPPTFVAMVYIALTDRSYRKTIISKRAEMSGKTQDLQTFTDLVHKMVLLSFK